MISFDLFSDSKKETETEAEKQEKQEKRTKFYKALNNQKGWEKLGVETTRWRKSEGTVEEVIKEVEDLVKSAAQEAGITDYKVAIQIGESKPAEFSSLIPYKFGQKIGDIKISLTATAMISFDLMFPESETKTEKWNKRKVFGEALENQKAFGEALENQKVWEKLHVDTTWWRKFGETVTSHTQAVEEVELSVQRAAKEAGITDYKVAIGESKPVVLSPLITYQVVQKLAEKNSEYQRQQ